MCDNLIREKAKEHQWRFNIHRNDCPSKQKALAKIKKKKKKFSDAKHVDSAG